MQRRHFLQASAAASLCGLSSAWAAWPDGKTISIVVPYAITDADGRLIVAPGTRVNPLDTVSLSKQLLFIDARDPAQVGRAKRFLDERGGRLKVILTGGSYLDLMRRWKQPVFFDQQGSLAEKLGIRHVPALVSQEDRRLRIDELL